MTTKQKTNFVCPFASFATPETMLNRRTQREIGELNGSENCPSLVTIDHKTLRSKRPSKQWVCRDKSVPNKTKAGLPANKVIVTVFRNTRCLIYFIYLLRGRIINGEYNVNSLELLKNGVEERKNQFHKH